MNDLSQEEGGAEYCEDEAERGPRGEEDGAFHLHAPSLQVVAHSHHYKPLKSIASIHSMRYVSHCC